MSQEIPNDTTGYLDCSCNSKQERVDNVRISQEFGECSCGKSLCFYAYTTDKEHIVGEAKSQAMKAVEAIETKLDNAEEC